MNPKLKKALPFTIGAVLILVVVIIIIVTRSGGTEPEDTLADSNAVVQAAGDNISEPTEDGISTGNDDSGDETEDTGEEVEPNTKNADGSFKAPSGKESVLKFYHNGLSKTGGNLKRTSYNRGLSDMKIMIKAMGKEVSLSDQISKEDWRKSIKDMDGMLKKGNSSAKTASDLKPFNAKEVASATAAMKGENVTVTIRLNNASRNRSNMQKGYAGYVGTVTSSECASLIDDFVKQFAGSFVKDVKIQTMDFAMSKGEYIVTMKQDGTIKKIEYSCKQTAKGEASAKVTAMKATVGAQFDMQFQCTYAS